MKTSKNPDFSKIVAIGAKSKMGRKLALKRKNTPKKPIRLSISKVQKLLWVECKRIVRARYPAFCFTCDKPIEGSNDHTSHFIPKGACGAYLKYELRNLRRCCYFCNIHMGGNGAEFYRRLVKIEGQDYVDTLFAEKNKIIKSRDYYEELLQKYKIMLH